MRSLPPLVFFLLITCSLAAQDKKDKLNEIMKTYHDFNMFDGSVLVAENGKVVYKSAFGMANREWNIPNTTSTKFMIGSVSKPLTAMLVLLQVQKGLIDLDQTVSYYIPEFSKKMEIELPSASCLAIPRVYPTMISITIFSPE